MPNNFLHIGLILLILPNARIIDARRHPIYRSGLEQWRNDEPWLGTLREELGDLIAAYPASL